MADVIQLLQNSYKCPYVKKTIAQCPFVSKHITLCPHLAEQTKDLPKAPSDDVDLRGFYTEAMKCPYVKKTFSDCPYVHDMVSKCPFIQEPDASSPQESEKTDEQLQPINIQVNEQGLLIPNIN